MNVYVQLCYYAGKKILFIKNDLYEDTHVEIVNEIIKMFGAMHFIYYINRLAATKVDSTYLGCLTSNAQRICPVAWLERMTTGLVVSALPYRASTSRPTTTQNKFTVTNLGQ